MKTIIAEEDIFKLIDASQESMFRTFVEDAVTRHFRSIQYLSSKLICDSIVLNLVLNDEITPYSADQIITCIRHKKKSFYTTVDSAYFSIQDGFEEYARSVLGSDYDNIQKLEMRRTNYIVYVISLDLRKNCNADSNEVYLIAYDYKEREERKLPHY